MGFTEIIFMSIGLGMDAFAVSICKGLSMTKMNWKKALIIALYFGIFQALMPVIGYLLGNHFYKTIEKIANYIAFFLIFAIGINMIKETIKNEEEDSNENVDFKTMSILALATSIDALAVGITFAFLQTNIVLAVTIIGVITFFISLIGVKIGNTFGNKYAKKAEFIGGFILILIGVKILLEHLGIF